MTEECKAALLAYCRLDDLSPCDEMLLENLYQAAVSYMTEAGVTVPEAGTPRRAQYDLCVYAIVLGDWDNRGTAVDGKTVESPAFRRKLNQLKQTEPPWTPPEPEETEAEP